MEKLYLGIDMGSKMAKGVAIDKDNRVVASVCLPRNGSPINACMEVVKNLKERIDKGKYVFVNIGVTGRGKRLTSMLLGAGTIKNEIVSVATGAYFYYPEAKVIFDLGYQDAKIIVLNEGNVIDYQMNMVGTSNVGDFISKVEKKLGIGENELETLAGKGKNNIDIQTSFLFFDEQIITEEMIKKYAKEDIASFVFRTIARAYLDNLCKGMEIHGPVVMSGGLAKNKGIIWAMKEILECPIYVDENAHLMGAIGVAILSKEEREVNISLDIKDISYETNTLLCDKCKNNCEITSVMKNKRVIGYFGNMCPLGETIHK